LVDRGCFGRSMRILYRHSDLLRLTSSFFH
jgi:hypothetical protein